MIYHVNIMQKPEEELKSTYMYYKKQIICEILFTVLLFVGNLLTMAFSINAVFFNRQVNFGVIPFTIFSLMSYFMQCITYWIMFNSLYRYGDAQKRAPLLEQQ